MSDEAHEWFDGHPVVVAAKSATLKYQELACRYAEAEADAAAVAVLEAVQAVGACNLYEEECRHQAWRNRAIGSI